ncbi:class I SAM-dependent methyltransferase [Phyllobacterium chamaecytisi]|uniref:class I SAM-dependent methyltransferase n=1 Tax=Phyllobacterium chamaecytisi TaxID=2876082 RepID=UPI001CCB9F6E|nr:class I SAM-dependent methyltransferase [Phyllobacterium sp. KW56]MBZ9601976.1 class I SAM-dependent methyltransferase [Phyllobacterium sp. KW56]
MTPLTSDDLSNVYGDSYDLGMRAPEADRLRAIGYCDQIATILAENIQLPEEVSVIEFGCGTGALLTEISNRWMISNALGIEPARQLVEVALRQVPKAVQIQQGYVDLKTQFSQTYDVCISVNVIEHTQNPIEFLSACRAAIKPDGAIVIICPDGGDPNAELLFRDHVSSFSVLSFSLSASKAGLLVTHTTALGGAQQGFRIYLLRIGTDRIESPSAGSFKSVGEMRNQYLLGWGEVEQNTEAAMGTRPFGIFGIGEYADLLASYCPDLTERAEFFVIDDPQASSHRGRRVISTEEFLSDDEHLALAAVNPRSWNALRQKFKLQTDRLLHPYQFTRLRTKLT